MPCLVAFRFLCCAWSALSVEHWPESAEEIDGFLEALERNTPLILRASGTLANTLGLLAGSVLTAYRGIEGAVGTGEQGRISQVDIIDTAIFVALIARFRTQLAQLLRTSAVRIVATLGATIAGLSQPCSVVFRQVWRP